MLKLGLLGHHISYTLSPDLHHRWLNNCGLKGSYDVYDLPICPDLKKDFRGFQGLNITQPYKILVRQKVDTMLPESSLNAVNTLRFEKDGTITGFNTDAEAFSILTQGWLKPKSVLILGKGGAAEASQWALQQRGVSHITFATRKTWRACLENLSHYDWIVNATPLGVRKQSLETFPLKKHHHIIDWVYDACETSHLIEQAIAHGLPFIHGESLLIQQARRSFEIWTGLPV